MRTRKEYLKDLENMDIPESHASAVYDFVSEILDDAEEDFKAIADSGNIKSLLDLSNLADAIDAAKHAAKALY